MAEIIKFSTNQNYLKTEKSRRIAQIVARISSGSLAVASVFFAILLSRSDSIKVKKRPK
jgi:hypothetical protein